MLKVKCHPNPFTEFLNIEYTTDEPVSLTIKMFDEIGLPVKDLMIDQHTEVGKYKVVFDGRELPRGLYVGLIRTDTHFQTVKLFLEDQAENNA